MTETEMLSEEQAVALSTLAKENTGPKFGYTHELCKGIIALVATSEINRERERSNAKRQQ